METKMCSMCRKVKPVSEFQWKPHMNKYYAYCNDCKKIYEREYKKARREMANEDRKKLRP